MDDVTFRLVLAKLQRLAPGGGRDVVAVRRDPTKEHGLIYETALGPCSGSVYEEDGRLVFTCEAKEFVIPIGAFLGKLH